MEKDSYYSGVVVWRNLFKKMIKVDDQSNVRRGYSRYIVTNDTCVECCFTIKDGESPLEKYSKIKGEKR